MAEEPLEPVESDEYSLAPETKPAPEAPKSSAFDAAPIRQRPVIENIPPGASAYVGDPPTPAEQSEARLIHLLGIATVLGPLIYLLKHKSLSPFVKDQANEAINFQITMLIAWIVGIPIAITMSCLAVPILTAIIAANVVSSIIAAIQVSSEASAYRYPYSIRLIK